jgi:hypothetical protein
VEGQDAIQRTLSMTWSRLRLGNNTHLRRDNASSRHQNDSCRHPSVETLARYLKFPCHERPSARSMNCSALCAKAKDIAMALYLQTNTCMNSHRGDTRSWFDPNRSDSNFPSLFCSLRCERQWITSWLANLRPADVFATRRMREHDASSIQPLA